MHFRPFKSLFAVSVASALLVTLVPDARAAGPKDKDAMKLHDKAMNDDYLGTEFAKAEKKLKDALALCGASDCSPVVVAKIQVALGTVYGVGLSKPDLAKEAFIAALKADPKAALDASLTTPDLTKLFEEAKKGGGSAAGAAAAKKPTPSGNAAAGGHTPPPESMVNTPLPIYFEPPEDQGVLKVSIRYKPFGATKYKSVEMRKMGKGFGAEIGCEDVTTTGDMKYYFVLTDENGDAAGTIGSQNDPFKVPLKNEIEGDAPRLPGKKPPDVCKDKTCPPGLPGCPEVGTGTGTGKRGDKGWGASCEQTTDCKEGYVCLNGSCEEGKDDGSGGSGKTDKTKQKRNLISVSASLDLTIISGSDNVCSAAKAGEATSNTCFDQDSDKQFFGIPEDVPEMNGIKGGFGLGGARFTVGYDRQLLANLGLALGARAGFAIGGSPSPSNASEAPDGQKNGISVAKSFLPLHLEGRASWFFGGGLVEKMKFRPYVFVGGGVAQVNASVPVRVCDREVDQDPPFDEANRGCLKTATAKSGQERLVDAYQVAGLGFIGLGGGTTFAFTPNFGVAAELRVMFMVPTFGLVFNPTIGPVFGF